MAENTTLLSDNDHSNEYNEEESHTTKILPANSHFKLPIKILSSFVSFFSISIFGLLIAAIVITNVGPFENTWSTGEAAQDLAICVGHSSTNYFLEKTTNTISYS